MSQKLLQAVAQNTRFKLVNLLKRTQGLSVQEIADRLEMSYMGVKESCQDLERRGLLDSRREPKPEGTTGRPRIVYRLTSKAQQLFPAASNPLTLEVLTAANRLHGSLAPEKLLMLAWQERGRLLVEKLSGGTLQERGKALARARDEDGHLATFEEFPHGGFLICEHHCPFLDVLRAYPIVAKLEVDLFQRVLGVAVTREEVQAGGLLRVDFRVT